MQDFLTFIVKQIAQNPDDVRIDTQESDYGYISAEIHVNQEDMGKIIGTSGRTISAIRKLAKAKAVKMGRRVNVRLSDQQSSYPEPQE